MKTKRILYSLCGVAVMAIAAFATYTEIQNHRQMQELTRRNLEVLLDGEWETEFTREACLSDGGNWNMASVCVATGFENTTCKIAGKISCFGITIEGSYEKGKTYPIPWARYECKDSPTNCCKKQGLYSGNIKLA